MLIEKLKKNRYSLTTNGNLIPREITDKINQLVQQVNVLNLNKQKNRVYIQKINQKGEFIGLGTMYEELRDGVGQYTTIIIKLADGTIVDLLPDEVKFVDV